MVIFKSTAQKIKFSIEFFYQQIGSNPQETADLVIFSKEILNGKLHLFAVVLTEEI